MSARTTLLLAPFLAALLPACDAGTKEKDAGNPGPQLVFVQPRMDHVYKHDPAVPEANRAAKWEKVDILLDLKNYVIGDSKKGADGAYPAGGKQHVHLILDNGEYQAIYDTSTSFVLKDEMKLSPGTHVLRAFPSAGPADAKGARWHESRKNDGAFTWVRFHVNEKGGDLADFDGSKPLLTYSRPKGSYSLADADKALLFPLMLDFYVSGCTLSKGGNHVHASVDGKEFDTDEWKAQTIAGEMAAGEHKIVIELLDAKGKPVGGPFNKTERTIKVTEK